MLKSVLWCAPALAWTLPCLSSSPECLAQLTELALDQSSEIEAINDQLTLIYEEREFAGARQWSHLLTLDPLRLVQNLLGGGDVQRARLEIASLDVEIANLMRRREAVGEEIASEVIDLVLDYEQRVRKSQLLAAQFETQRQRQRVQEAKYRTGQSSTDAMLRVWQRTGDLEARCDEHRIDGHQVVRQLEVMTGSDSYRSFMTTPCMDWLYFVGQPSLSFRIVEPGEFSE